MTAQTASRSLQIPFEAADILTMPLDLAKADRGRGPLAVASLSSLMFPTTMASKSRLERGRYPGSHDSHWAGLEPSFAKRLTAAHMALTPTLTLWDFEGKRGKAPPAEIEKGMSRAAQQLKAFSQLQEGKSCSAPMWPLDMFGTSEEFA